MLLHFKNSMFKNKTVSIVYIETACKDKENCPEMWQFFNAIIPITYSFVN